MKPIAAINDFVVKFANVNGSGSASANELFAKSILRMGVPVSPRNIFPSNIQGLPTWYEVRVNEKGHLGRRGGVDLMVAMNPQTWDADLREIEPGGYLFYDSTKPLPKSKFRDDVNVIGVPLTEICNRTYTDARQRPRAVVEEVAAGLDLGDVGVPGLRVHRDHHVHAAAPAAVALLADPRLVPGRQALDVAREDVARADRHAHAQQAAREQLVRRRRPGAVDVRELDDEVVDGFDSRRGARPHVARHVSTGTFLGAALRQPLPARVWETVNFCMSHAPVGQRSAHSPQCRQTSSSLTMTRPVFNASET